MLSDIFQGLTLFDSQTKYLQLLSDIFRCTAPKNLHDVPEKSWQKIKNTQLTHVSDKSQMFCDTV